ncbi:MAG: site-specific DNA-methyltransferase [Candidimonas sp.]
MELFDSYLYHSCMIFFERNEQTIINGDFINQKFNESPSLIVTSPPYNLDIKYASYEDVRPYEDYLEWSYKWIRHAYEVGDDQCRFCMNIPLETNLGGNRPIAADLTKVCMDAGWSYRATLVWNKNNTHKRTAWGSFMRASAPCVIAPVEVILVFFKNEWKRIDPREPTEANDITRDEFINWTNGLWSMTGESAKRIGHPAPYPIELPLRCMKLFSHVGDVILDPFLGSGTTLIATTRSRRKGIGTEMDRGYCELAVKRVMEEIQQSPHCNDAFEMN